MAKKMGGSGGHRTGGVDNYKSHGVKSATDYTHTGSDGKQGAGVKPERGAARKMDVTKAPVPGYSAPNCNSATDWDGKN
jgi:hypothetical protein